MIRFENVSYQYQDTKETKQLTDIELTIPQGHFLLVTGKSGCGKSTLAQCINGLIPYFHEGEMTGSVWLGNYETTELSIEEIGEKVGSVFQDPRSQFFTTNTTDEIAFGCQNMSLPREEILKRVEETIRTFRIEDLRDRSLFELSSGQKQKVAIASCYCMKPDIYIMDEPSANLDPVAIAELAEVLAALKAQGNTIILIEHRLYYAKDLMDEMIYMENGRIAERMSREEALALSGEELGERGLKVAPNILLHADEQRITQLFTILLDNAIKYMGRPGTIRIEGDCIGQHARIIFSDDGVGIPKEDIPNVFTRFYRVDKSRTGQQGGSGLGLAIAKWIVEAHGGKITLKSGEGKGVVYTILI